MYLIEASSDDLDMASKQPSLSQSLNFITDASRHPLGTFVTSQAVLSQETENEEF